MISPIARDLLVAYATTLGAFLCPGRSTDDPGRLRLRREHLEALGELYTFLRGHEPGARIELGTSVVVADSEGSISFRTRGPTAPAWLAPPCPN